MRHRTRKNSKLNIILLVAFLICLVMLLFYTQGPVKAVSSRVSLPDHLYDYIILPLLYFFGGYTISWLVFLKGNVSFSGGMRAIFIILAVAAVILFLSLFLRTRLGLAIRATGSNADMVRSSSINPIFTTTVGLCISNAFTGLSGCLMAQQGKSFDINVGSGMLTVALAFTMMLWKDRYPTWLEISANTLSIVFFVAVIDRREKFLRQLPFIGKYFK